jgi:hypothetical protein
VERGERPHSCFSCGEALEQALISVAGVVVVCNACVRLIVQLALRGRRQDVEEIWEGVPVSPFEPESLSPTAEHSALSADDVEAHENLAIAYSEMGLYRDAVREAAIALSSQTSAPRANGALRTLLTPPMMKRDGMRALRAQLRLRLAAH